LHGSEQYAHFTNHAHRFRFQFSSEDFIVDLLNHVRSTIATVKNALADGTITSDEAKAIVKEILALALEVLGGDQKTNG
jgi:hypothetical protein